MIACNGEHLDEVHRWWESLTEDARAEFLSMATITPESLGTAVTSGNDEDADEHSEWYEYIVNQDVRFYYDRSNPQGDGFFKIVYPIISPVSSSADAFVVSRLLTRPDR